MKYISTRGNHENCTASQAIEKGICSDRGLFVPKKFPHVSLEEIEKMKEMNYKEVALNILKRYLTDYSEEELKECIGVYDETFSHPEKTPVVKLKDGVYVLELWHGPTLAFKDMALQIMPRLFTQARKKNNAEKESLILVATSGDTGKAALEGFKDLKGVRVVVFYPAHGVSDVQRLQMLTSEGENVEVVGVVGNFDDCQTAVKNIFLDEELNLSLDKFKLSSANSINLGRLLPQIIYYFKAYLQLLRDNEITLGETIDFSVPTGNFGDILAGYYAKQMGLPVGKLICASNKNNVLYDFLKTGIYNKQRDFFKTMSPSMDILVSSNLERLIYHILEDGKVLNRLYNEFEETGILELDTASLKKIQETIAADYSTEDECLETIYDTFDKNNYMIDPHTAVAMNGGLKNKSRKTVVLSTANIYKFSSSILKAFDLEKNNEFENIEALEKLSKEDVPLNIKKLKSLKILHTKVVEKDKLGDVLRSL
ncbi:MULTISPECIES: threonine synthase [Psychrilyobacter]|uniref:Threonine synthase n=1 Tax=Psychrilyobacter piezotolerans TaxID=2293438 RepID=A0ABX9KHP0_9FUSO|nr:MULTISPECIES: threonine synthase [Psychrilyobacter]MCS5420656.1 threonine synthase [Psychrilyobacter sp. S5]NDI77830.1 threonine synthase [Psychrilyobacter piezotolerans]RDE62316.1 threonine synthase [Psychrilyobacter sp. S5]REI41414.1 threonine synthase [Psychrilyobacter piezotolerans]